MRMSRFLIRIKKNSLTPQPPLLQRGGVLGTVRLEIMKSLSLTNLFGKVCLLFPDSQGVSRISLPSLWGRGKGEGPVVSFAVLLSRLPIPPHNTSQPEVDFFLQTEKGPRTAEGHITELPFDGRAYLLKMNGLPNMVHDRQTMLAVGCGEFMAMKVIEHIKPH